MGTLENHKKLYEIFKRDAEKEDNAEPTRAELYFLSIFHLIEACGAKSGVHFNKHQNIRKILEKNSQIFKEQTNTVWDAFQNIENRLRPKFSYGFSWKADDLEKLKEYYFKLEEICLKAIENDSRKHH
jgi:hypothetical protein